MSFEADFRAFLLADAAFSAAVDGRVYLARLPKQPEYPVAIWRVISDVPSNDHDTLGEEIGQKRLQVDLYAVSGHEAVLARDALKAAANGFAGVVGTTDFQQMDWATSVSLDEKALDVYRYSCDLMVWSRPV